MSGKEREWTFSEAQESRIADWLRKVKFRKQVFGGVSQADVFRKIGELNDMYREALIAERARYDALLAERSGGAESAESNGAADAKEGESE